MTESIVPKRIIFFRSQYNIYRKYIYCIIIPGKTPFGISGKYERSNLL